MREQKISVVINTYNAERYLKKVLETVKSFDEVVVCDMESTDNTLVIAKEYGCKIVMFPKGEHKCAEPARTFAIQSATYPWILVVDADELITPQLHDYLYERISHEDCPEGLYIPRKNYFMGRHCNYPDYQLHFFIKEGTVWPPYVHTFPKVQGRLEYIPKRHKELAIVHLVEDTIHLRLIKTNDYSDNEVLKRHNETYSGFALVFKPLWRFMQRYFFKGGLQQGKSGFIDAVLAAIYKFIAMAKVIESKTDNMDSEYKKYLND